MKGKRWRFDGEKVYLLGGREWTIPMPANRDLAIAVKDALASNQVSATIQNNMIRFEADDDGVVRIRAVVNEVYSQQRSEERRVGKEFVEQCKSRWSP